MVNTARKKENDHDNAKNAKKDGGQHEEIERAKYNITSCRSRKTIQDSLPSRRAGVSKLRNYSCSWPTETLTRAIRGFFAGTAMTCGN